MNKVNSILNKIDKYNYLMYVRQSLLVEDKIEVFAVNTEDIFHTMGEYIYRSSYRVNFITYNKITPERVKFWENSGHEIKEFNDIYISHKGV